MKTISAGLKAHLEGEVLTICTLWKITRTDGKIFGFTDTSRDITYFGQLYQASTGHTPSNIKSTATLGVDNLEVQSILDSSSITEADIQAGLWDYAQVEIVLANYMDLTMGHMSLRKGWIGNIKTGRTGFTAELRGMMQPLQQVIGRLYTAACDAYLGDARCGKDISTFTHQSAVSATGGNRSFTISGVTSNPGDPYYLNTSLSLHCNGTDTSTIFTDTSYRVKTVVPNGTAQLSIAQYKFAPTSAYFDGSGSFLSVPHHVDLDLSSGDFAIECQAYFITTPTTIGSILLAKRLPTGGYGQYVLYRTAANKIGFVASQNGTTWAVNITGTTSIVPGQFYNIEVNKYENIYTLYINGVQEATATVVGTLVSDTNPLNIGAEGNSTSPVNGYLDEIRITKGIARHTTAFTPPVAEFYDNLPITSDAYGKADGYFNGGIITWLSGANKTYKMEIKTHVSNTITLQQSMPANIAIGDTYTMVAGCDKIFTTCGTKYNNVVNFRGFPHIPGQDKLVSGS